MKCTEFTHHIDNILDAQLGDPQLEIQWEAHRASCDACQALYTAEMSMLAAMRAMPVPEPRAGFANRVLTNAIKHNQPLQHHQHHHRQGFMLGFGSAAAAALALWVVVGLIPGKSPDTASNQTFASADASKTAAQPVAKQPVLSIALNEQRSVKLAFFSGEPLQGAKITISLPENVALVGYPGRRQLSWETNLKKGDNMLSLPVIATQVARGELIANIEYRGRVKTLRLNLETNSAGTSSINAVDLGQGIG